MIFKSPPSRKESATPAEVQTNVTARVVPVNASVARELTENPIITDRNGNITAIRISAPLSEPSGRSQGRYLVLELRTNRSADRVIIDSLLDQIRESPQADRSVLVAEWIRRNQAEMLTAYFNRSPSTGGNTFSFNLISFSASSAGYLVRRALPRISTPNLLTVVPRSVASEDEESPTNAESTDQPPAGGGAGTPPLTGEARRRVQAQAQTVADREVARLAQEARAREARELRERRAREAQVRAEALDAQREAARMAQEQERLAHGAPARRGDSGAGTPPSRSLPPASQNPPAHVEPERTDADRAALDLASEFEEEAHPGVANAGASVRAGPQVRSAGPTVTVPNAGEVFRNLARDSNYSLTANGVISPRSLGGRGTSPATPLIFEIPVPVSGLHLAGQLLYPPADGPIVATTSHVERFGNTLPVYVAYIFVGVDPSVISSEGTSPAPSVNMQEMGLILTGVMRNAIRTYYQNNQAYRNEAGQVDNFDFGLAAYPLGPAIRGNATIRAYIQTNSSPAARPPSRRRR